MRARSRTRCSVSVFFTTNDSRRSRRVSASFRPDAGAWTGLTRVEIEERWPGHLAEWRTPDGYEPDHELLVRVLEAIADLHSRHRGRHLFAVAHGGVLRALDRHHGVHDQHFPNLGGRRFMISGEQAEVSLGERVSLLDGLDVTVTTPNQI